VLGACGAAEVHELYHEAVWDSVIGIDENKPLASALC
jgi:hypothetical protein